MPLERQVRLTFDRFTGFVDEISGNISLGGMFVRSSSPPATGTQVKFEFSLEDGYQLIRGTGEVMWARPKELGPDQPAGFGIRFLYLDPGSEELIVRVMEEFLESGGTPFDLERAGGTVPPPEPTPMAGLEPPKPPRASGLRGSGVAGSGAYGSRGRSAARRGNPWLIRGLLVAALVAVTALGYALILREGEPAAGDPVFGPTRPGRVVTADGEALPLDASAESPSPPVTEEGREAVGDSAPPTPEPTSVAQEPPSEPDPGSTDAVSEPVGAPESSAPTSRSGASSASQGSELTIIDAISWQEGPGWTEVTIDGDGPIVPASYTRLRLDDPTARELFRFKRIVRPFPEGRIPVASPQLLQVRVGYHHKPDGNELHLVFDLTNPAVHVVRVSREGSQMRIRLEVTGG
jgi:uncharacterized protein (TIGR02266 family)